MAKTRNNNNKKSVTRQQSSPISVFCWYIYIREIAYTIGYTMWITNTRWRYSQCDSIKWNSVDDMKWTIYTHTDTLPNDIERENCKDREEAEKVISLKWNISKIWCKSVQYTVHVLVILENHFNHGTTTKIYYENSILSHMKWIAEESKKGGWSKYHRTVMEWEKGGSNHEQIKKIAI